MAETNIFPSAQDGSGGWRTVVLLATDEVSIQGLHGRPLRARGCLPWGPLRKRLLVPIRIDEVVKNCRGLGLIWQLRAHSLMYLFVFVSRAVRE